MVVSSPMLTHFNEEVYPNPLQYNPDRWVDPERKISVINNRNYVQFGYGRHRCLVLILCRNVDYNSVLLTTIFFKGERFANLVIKTTLSRILRMCVPELLEPLPDPDYRKATGTPGPGIYSPFVMQSCAFVDRRWCWSAIRANHFRALPPEK